jgi:hypothetical protein
LHDVFCILAILGDVLGYAKELALVLADQRIVGRHIAFAHPCHQGYVWMRLELSCNRLDGWHGYWLQKPQDRLRMEIRGPKMSVPDGAVVDQTGNTGFGLGPNRLAVPLCDVCGNVSGSWLPHPGLSKLK